MTKKEITQLSYEITGCAIEVHKALGPGLLESVYQKCFIIELELKGFQIKKSQIVNIEYKGHEIEAELRYDVLVNDCVVVELKAVDVLHPVYTAQLLTYMNLLKVPQGLLLNFNVEVLKDGVIPLVNAFYKALND